MIIEDLQRTAKEIRAEGHLGWGNVCDDAAARIAELEKALHELHATVRGECPSVLNEDSGGNGELDVRICGLLGL